jgi:hypothetical protein
MLARNCMQVGVDEAGHQHAPAEIDDLGRCGDPFLDTGIGPDEDDLAVAHRDRLSLGAAGVQRHDVAVAQHDVGRPFAAAAAAHHQGRGQGQRGSRCGRDLRPTHLSSPHGFRTSGNDIGWPAAPALCRCKGAGVDT